MSQKTVALVVSQTHWDREWYFTFQQFRFKLVSLMDRLLDLMERDERYRHFVLDGQTIPLLDYLEIRPENEGRIRALSQAGRLHLGPWHVLPDVYLVSPEALVRNLLIGHSVAKRFGPVMKVGYTPDPFGHPGQMPQIMAGFGVNSYIFTRGLGDEALDLGTEFYWEAPDGSRVLAAWQKGGYCNCYDLGYVHSSRWRDENVVDHDAAEERVKKLLKMLRSSASTQYVLFNNGCDHLPAQPELPDILAEVNRRLPNVELVHSTFAEYVDCIRRAGPPLKTFRGELHGGRTDAILSGVYSARMYLKQANHDTQNLLEKWAEPFAAASMAMGGRDLRPFLTYSWGLLLQNHPHDSICGCSVDQVHREMMGRYEQSRQVAQRVMAEGADYLVRHIQTRQPNLPEGAVALVVFNPHAWTVSDVVTARMEEPLDREAAGPRPVRILDDTGKEVASQVSDQWVGIQTIPVYDNLRLRRYEVSFLATLPALGYRTYYLDHADPAAFHAQVQVSDRVLENEFLRVEVADDGAISVHDKRTGTTHSGLNVFEDTEDVGDEYDYSHAKRSKTILSSGGKAACVVEKSGPVLAALRVELEMRLPEAAREDRKGRSRKKVPCRLTSFLTLKAGVPRLEIKTQIDNQVRDHRLRALFPSRLSVDHCFAEGHFDVMRRSLALPSGKGWAQKPVATHHHRTFVDVCDTDGGLAVANRGLPEYEVKSDAGSATIALTLLRCVGWVSRPDAPDRPYNVGPAISTPDAQCIGTQSAEYCVIPHQGTSESSCIWQQAHTYDEPPWVYVGREYGDGKLPPAAGLIRVNPEGLVISSMKPAEHGDATIIRAVNLSTTPWKGTVSFFAPATSVQPVNLNEEPIGAAQTTGEIALEVPPKRIVTYAVRW